MNKLFIPALLFGVLFTSCSKDEETVLEKKETTESRNLEVENFIYDGMNEIYLYKADVPALADNYFTSYSKKQTFLAGFDSPEELYEALQWSKDDFSFMTADYVALRKYLDEGITGTTGMDYGLSLFSNSDDVFGYVRYVLPNSSAEANGIKRGDFFTEINGQSLNLDNYQELLGLGSYSLRVAKMENNTIYQTDKIVDLVKEEIAEDPVFINKVLEVEGQKIGYLMYTGFTPDFDSKLNAAFGEFRAAGITDLVLDLRYNGGGDVETASDLASMITGQFDGQVLITYHYNQKYQKYFEENNPERLIKRFNSVIRTNENINSLNLTKVYVLATRSSASASELVIHSLKPYINVIQIGTNTRGKYQASTTLYDSPNFWLYDDNGNLHVNPNHTYAIQPLILKYANSKAESDFVNGLYPDIEVKENWNVPGVLGDPSETLLKAAINDILGRPQDPTSASMKKQQLDENFLGESDMFNPAYQRMYLERLPEIPVQRNN